MNKIPPLKNGIRLPPLFLSPPGSGVSSPSRKSSIQNSFRSSWSISRLRACCMCSGEGRVSAGLDIRIGTRRLGHRRGKPHAFGRTGRLRQCDRAANRCAGGRHAGRLRPALRRVAFDPLLGGAAKRVLKKALPQIPKGPLKTHPIAVAARHRAAPPRASKNTKACCSESIGRSKSRIREKPHRPSPTSPPAKTEPTEKNRQKAAP